MKLSQLGTLNGRPRLLNNLFSSDCISLCNSTSLRSFQSLCIDLVCARRTCNFRPYVRKLTRCSKGVPVCLRNECLSARGVKVLKYTPKFYVSSWTDITEISQAFQLGQHVQSPKIRYINICWVVIALCSIRYPDKSVVRTAAEWVMPRQRSDGQ